MVDVYTKSYVRCNGVSFEKGSEIILKHKDGREFVCTIETITKEWIEVWPDDETFNVYIENIVSIKNNQGGE